MSYGKVVRVFYHTQQKHKEYHEGVYHNNVCLYVGYANRLCCDMHYCDMHYSDMHYCDMHYCDMHYCDTNCVFVA
jgi:hypothetical protein